MSASLTDRVAIVTGSASGIGAAIGKELRRRGARVVLVDISPQVPPAKEDSSGADDRGALVLQADVAAPGAAEEIVAGALDHFGRLDVLVNNVGVMDGMSAITDTSDETWRRVLGVNLTGPFALTRAALQPMLDAGRGAVVNVASVAALFGARGGVSYTVSKHGLIGLTKSVAAHYADHGIRANAVCPGGVRTAMGDDWPAGFGADAIDSVRPSMPRSGEPAEVATVVAFLASDEASFVNGAVITADAGWSAR